MVHFRIEIKNHGRGMVSKQAYRFGTKEFDKHHQRHFDYRSKDDVVRREVIMPTGVPEWAHNEGEFWRAAEKASNRQDARIAKEFIISLPRELDQKSSENLLRTFIDREFTQKSLGATLAIHDPKAADGERNPHAHILVSMRPLDEKGFARRKLRDFDSAKGVKAVRERWAQTLNQEFERQRLPHRVHPNKARAPERASQLLARAQSLQKKGPTKASRSPLHWAGRTQALSNVSSQIKFFNQQLAIGRIPNPITDKPGALNLARKLGRETFREPEKEQQHQQQEHELALTRDMRW
ncbi:MobA/MobL family protein [Kordiimonas lacus]|uniref:MobA/MobL family protein n=2 Tax=Kordiimonas lacus TaxID=637679 RepID=A0A1G6U7I0_9PROT|nr:MobA/MobL family protein [Kordiimonas lacus]